MCRTLELPLEEKGKLLWRPGRHQRLQSQPGVSAIEKQIVADLQKGFFSSVRHGLEPQYCGFKHTLNLWGGALVTHTSLSNQALHETCQSEEVLGSS